MDFSFLSKYYPYYISGALTTFVIALTTVCLGTIIGLIFALLKISKIKVLKLISTVYIEIVRGTPALLQVMICYSILTKLITIPNITIIGDMDLSRLIPGIIAMSINSGAYVAEVIRSGIMAVDKGQTEAASSLGMKSSMTMRFIILPQAIKNILPALGNEFVTVIKESSILSVIAIAELMFNASTVQSRTFRPLEPLFVAAGIYFIMTFTTSRIIAFFERRMNTDDRS